MISDSSSRRAFLAKVASAALALNFTGRFEQKAFSAELPLNLDKTHPVMKSDKKFVPVMLTPFDAGLRIDFEGLSRLIDFYLRSGAKGFFANCASSEMYNLDNAERLALVKHVVKHVNGKMPVVATGSFGNSIEERATFSKKMFDTGVDAVILITSHFATKDEDDSALMKNLEEFLRQTGSIPLGTYECPSPYKRILSPDVLRYLLSTDRLVYHKDTSLNPETVNAKLNIARNTRLEFYDAHTPNTQSSLQAGAKGMSCIAGNFYPEIFAWMCDNVLVPERKDDVSWLQSELTRVDRIISQGYSLSAKYFLQKRGLQIEINSRKTKTGLSHTQIQALDKVFADVSQWRDRLGINERYH